MEQKEEKTILPYLALIGAFCCGSGGLLYVGSKKKKLPRKISARDLALLGIATHRLTRIITRDRVAMPLREPFTENERCDGAGAMHADPKGEGLQRAIGTLITCQYCMGPWIASALITAFALRPRETRVACSMLAVTTASDFTHQAYAFMRKCSD